MYDFTYTCNLKNNTKTNSEREIRLMVTRGGRWGEGEMKKSDEKIGTFCYKMSEYQEHNVQHND